MSILWRKATNEPLPAEVVWEAVPEEKLAGLAAGRDKGAFGELMRRYNTLLYRVARSVTGEDTEAEDVLQESWLRAYTNLAQFRGEARLATWLVRITLNEALGRKRRARPTLEINDKTIELGQDRGASVVLFPSAPVDPECNLSRRQAAHILEQAIDTLPMPFRTVFMLRLVEEMSVEEVAQQLDIPEITVRTRTHRARGLLRKALEKKLSSGFKDVFPFAGDRCRAFSARVLQKIEGLEQTR